MSGGEQIGADLLCRDQKLIELQVIVAEAAGNGCAPGEIFVNEWTYHVSLKPVLMIYDVVGNSEMLGYMAGIINVVQRAAAPTDLLRHAFASGQSPLVPELHRESHDGMSLGAQHGRHGGRIHSSGHGDGDGWLGHG
jgi:hypothetical protein